MLPAGSSASFARAARPFSCLVITLCTLVLLAGLPGRAGAQTTYSSSSLGCTQGGTGVTISGGYASGSCTIDVTGAPGTVASVQVLLNGVTSSDNCEISNSVGYTSFMLKGPNGQTFMLLGAAGDGIDGDDGCDSGSGLAGVNITFKDGATQAPGCTTEYGICGALPHTGSPTYEPTSYWYNVEQGPVPSIFAPPSVQLPLLDGLEDGYSNQTFASVFDGGAANGGWTLTVENDYPDGADPVSFSNWSLTLAFSAAVATTTTVSSSLNPSYTASPNSSTTFTATVSSSSGTPTGTVTFQANGSTISGCSAQPLSGGQATCNTTLTSQGIYNITAEYGGTSSYGASSSSTTQLVELHPSQNGNTWCNSGSIPVPGSNAAGSVYPSMIQVSGYPAGTTVSSVEVQLISTYGTLYAGHLLVAPDGSHNLDFFDGSWFNNTLSSGQAVNLNFFDTAGQYPNPDTSPSSGNYEASDDNENVGSDTFPGSSAPTYDSGIPQVPGTVNKGYNPFFPGDGGPSTNTFEAEFSGAPANGDWALYPFDNDAYQETIGGGWCIQLAVNTGTPTTTTVSSSQQRAAAKQAVNLTASVTASGSPVTSGGTVTFLDNGQTPSGNTSNTITLNSNGQATYNTGTVSRSLYNYTGGNTTVYEGDHDFTAEYSGVTDEDNPSSITFWQRFDNPSTPSWEGSGSPNSYSYCNAGPVLAVADDIGAFYPNPSNVFVTNLPGTVNTVGVTLNGLATNGSTSATTQSLLAGPTGAGIDFFSDTGQSATGNSFSVGNYMFADSGSILVPSSPFGPGTYKPTSNSSSADTFTSSPFYTVPSNFGYAAPHGSATFGSTFGDTNGNGTWSLFLNLGSLEGETGAMSGWCLNFTENPASVTATLSHSGTGLSGDFVQGEQAASITANIANNGTGPTGDPVGSNTNPLTVTDTLNSAFTYNSSVGNGTDWFCLASGQTVTCTNDDSVAQSSSYPQLTIGVNVSPSAGSSIANSISVSGAGVTSTSANDTITVDPPPSLAVSLSHTGTFTQGQNAAWNITVSNTAASGATSRTITVNDTLPTGYTLAGSTSTSDNFGCGAVANVVTCTSIAAINGGSNNVIALTVAVPANSPTSVSDIASAYGGGDPIHSTAGTAAVSNVDTVTVVQVPASVAVESGNNQSTPDLTNFTPLAVTVTDAGGVGVPGAIVTFTAPTQTGPSISFAGGVNTATTNSSGAATSVAITANRFVGGPYTVTANVSPGAGSTSFQLTNTIGAYAQLAVTAPSSTYVGVPLQFTVTAEDAGGNPVPGINDTLSFTSSDAAATLPPNTALVNSMGTFTTTLNTAGSQTITATDTATSILGISGVFTVAPAPFLVVTTNGDDAGNANNCTTQSSSTSGTDAACSLRDALMKSASLGAASISFDSSKFSSSNSAATNTVTLGTAGTMTIPSYTSINGPLAGTGVTVNGSNTYAIFTTVANSARVSINGLTISNGNAGGSSGAGIQNNGALIVANSTFSNDFAPSGYGGAVELTTGATLSISGSTFTGNTAMQGAAIYDGGAASIKVVECTFSQNNASQAGGAILVSAAQTSVTDSTFASNSSTGYGGSVYTFGTITLANNIFVADSANASGGAIYNQGGSVTANYNLFYNNTAATGPDCDQCTANTNVITANPNLAALGSYGGPTRTMIPLPSSAAICAGSVSLIPSGVITDQRGEPNTNTTYPGFTSGTACVDVGAVQTNYAIAFTTQPSPISPATQINANQNFQAAITLDESGTPFTGASVSIPLTLTGGGILTGGSATTSGGVATYSALSIAGGGPNEVLNASLLLNGSSVQALELSPPSAAFAVGGPMFGHLDLAYDGTTKAIVVYTSDNLLVSGWALDAQSAVSKVEVLIDGNVVGNATLGIARPDIVAAFDNSAYLDSGWNFTYAASGLTTGTHTVTAIAFDSANNPTTLVTPISITVSSASTGNAPLGNVDSALDRTTRSGTVAQTDSLVVSGWAADPQQGAPVSKVKILIDGTVVGNATLGIARPDVEAASGKASYLNSGWMFTYAASGLSAGTHTVWAIATDALNLSTNLGSKLFVVTASSQSPPFGNLDQAVDANGRSTTVSPSDNLLVTGWAVDPQVGAPVSAVRVLIDGSVVGLATLGIARPDIKAAFNDPSYLNSGWTFTYAASTLSAGSHTVTAVASDSLGLSTTVGTKTITVP